MGAGYKYELKVPGRHVYCCADSLVVAAWLWIRSTLWCHVALRVMPRTGVAR